MPPTIELPDDFGFSDNNAYVLTLVGLGLVTMRSAHLEGALRRTYCALVESPMAAVTAAGQNASWLLEEIKALAMAHRGVTPESRGSLRTIAAGVRVALATRNDYVHAAWGVNGSDQWTPIKGQRKTHRITARPPITLADFQAAASALNQCSNELEHWVVKTLGVDALGHEGMLRWLEDRDGLDALPPQTP